MNQQTILIVSAFALVAYVYRNQLQRLFDDNGIPLRVPMAERADLADAGPLYGINAPGPAVQMVKPSAATTRTQQAVRQYVINKEYLDIGAYFAPREMVH